MALTVLSPTPAAGGAVRLEWLNQLIAAINATGSTSDVTFAAGNFTANGSMTWTVDAGDVGTNTYWRYEKVIEWALVVDATTVGGTPNTELLATIPLGLSAAKAIIVPMIYIDNGTRGVGYAQTSGTTVRLLKISGNWSASTNNTSIYVFIRIPTTT